MKPKRLLILATGCGTRNAYFTYNNALPKCLMSVGDKTCLEAILDSYDSVGLMESYVVVRPEHAEAVKSILRYRNKQCHVLAIEPEESALGNLVKAFRQFSGESIETSDWFINWSDVYQDGKYLNLAEPEKPCIFVDNKPRHRNFAYVAIDGSVNVVSTTDKRGNVPGIFYVPGAVMSDFIEGTYGAFDDKVESTLDFDVCLSTDFDCTLQYVDITDIGDYDKYAALMTAQKKEAVCRYFNSIDIGKTEVIKRPVTPKGEELHVTELAYYRMLRGRETPFAKLMAYDVDKKAMTLERIKGKTCHAYVDSLPSTQRLAAVNRLIKKFETAAEELHKTPCINRDTPEDIEAAIRNEFFDMIETRVRPCMPAIQAVIESNDIRSIDGLRIVSYDRLLEAVQKWLNTKLAEGYFNVCFCHGDPNTDNTMLTSKGDIRFIDPRGYFGKLKTLGLGVAQYDLAKFVYGFSGYGRFNSAEFISMFIEDNDCKVAIGIREEPGMADIDLFDIKADNDIKVLVGIIWVKLTSYIINDPMKSVAAYLYGNALLTKLLDIK